MGTHRCFTLMVAMQDVRKFVDEIKAAGGDAVLYVYPGEGHAFMNAQSDSIERMKSESQRLLLFKLYSLPD